MVLVAAVVLGLADSVAGIWYRTGTEAAVHVVPARSGVANQVVVAFPGFTMPGDLLARAFAPHLGDDDAMLVVGYAERGIDIDAIHRRVIREIAAMSPARVRVYGASMGGVCARELLARYRRDGTPFGPVVLVLDTAPSQVGDVRQPGALFDLAVGYRGGPLSTVGWAAASRLRGQPPAEPSADRRVTAAASHAGAWAGMPAITSQAAYLGGSTAPRPGELVPVAERVVYLRGRPGGPDPLIDVDRAITGWRQAFPHLTVTTFQHREERWHLPIIQRPQETVAYLLAA